MITFSALTDVECFSSMLRFHSFMKLGEMNLRKEKQRLYGIEKGKNTAIGNFISDESLI